jgi:glycosyltransferase involved in cell wall biosynthesis
MDVGNRPDFIYVVNLDALDKAAAILGSPFGDTPFGGMMVLPRFHHRAAGLVSAGSRCDRLYGHLFASLLRTKSLRLVTTIDPLLAPWCRDLGLRESHKVAFVPDIGDLSPDEFSRSGARSMLGLNQDAFVLLVYGLINPSKGVRELLQAIDGDHWPVGLQLLVVGRPDEAMGALIADQKFSMMQREGRVIARIGYAGADLTSAAFRSASAVWLGYKGHDNMSGVLCQATEAGVPVVACRNGLVGLYTKAHGIGEVVNVDNPCEIVGAIRRLMSSSGPLAAYASNAARLRNTHTPTVFGRTICDAIMSQL